MTVKPRTIFGRSKGITSIVTTLNQEVNSVCLMKNHSQSHCDMLTWSGEQILPWMCWWNAEKNDHWSVDGDRNLSKPWTFFTLFTILNEKPPDGYTWSWRSWQKFKEHQGLIIYGQIFGQGCQKQLNERKSSNGLSRSRSPTMLESWAASTLLIR